MKVFRQKAKVSLVKVFRLDGNEEQRNRGRETIISPLACWFTLNLKILNLYLGPNYPSSSGSFSHSMFRVTGFWTFGFQPETGYNLAFVTSTTVIILC